MDGKTEPRSAEEQHYSQQPTIFEYLSESMRYENDGTGTREVQARLRVQTAAGLSSAGQLVFPYNAYNETMQIRSVRVLRKDGSVAVEGPVAVQDLSAPTTQVNQFRRDSAPPRTVEIANAKGGQGIIQYTVLIDGNSRVTEFSPTMTDDQLADLHDAIRSAVMPQSFPDDTLRALPRIGTLSCQAADKDCLWILLPVYVPSCLTPAN